MRLIIIDVNKITNQIIRRAVNKPQVAAKWLMLAVLGIFSLSFTQTGPGEWQTPYNLSSSGSATEPLIIVDNTGRAHVIWADTGEDSYVFLWGKPNAWSGKRPVELPFGTRQSSTNLASTDPTPLYKPTMVADTAGNIHAWWLDKGRNLFYSRVPAADFNIFTEWLEPQQLATGISGLSTAADESGGLHISYIQTLPSDSLQTGVYYQNLANPNAEWTEPALLYQSPYYLRLPAEQANTHIAVKSDSDDSHVYLAWDNRPVESLFFSRSLDGGLSWEDPTTIDARRAEDGSDTDGPKNIKVVIDGDTLLLIWQAGHDLNTCNQYYQSSTDDGETWQAPAIMLKELPGCPENYRILGSGDQINLFFFFHLDQPYLLAWRDGQWSDPQIQQELSSFVSPETFRRIDLNCLQLALVGQNQILAVGCGTGFNEKTADIWQLSRQVGDIESWFPSSPPWEKTEALVAGSKNMSPPILATDNQGKIHAIWSQLDETDSSQTAVYYTSLDEGRWSQAVPILISPDGAIAQLEMALTEEDQLLVILVASSGKMYFSQASADRAFFRTDWSSLVELPSARSFISGADIAVSDDNTIYVASSVPINNERGVYLQKSSSDGKSWSQPILVLDGEMNGWDVVGAPRLEITGDGSLHLMIAEEVPKRAGTGWASTALYYSRSGSLEEEFSQPELVSETPVVWADLIDDGHQKIHRLWQEQVGTVNDVRHDYSKDNGNTWLGPALVTNLQGPMAIAVDSGGQLHSVQVDNGVLSHRIWDGVQWLATNDSGSLQFGTTRPEEPQSVGIAIVPDQILAALITTQELTTGGSESLSNTYFTWRTINSPAGKTPSLTSPDPSVTVTSSGLPVEEPIVPEEVSTAIIEAATDQGSQKETASDGESNITNMLDNDNPIVGSIVSLLPVVLFLLIIFGIGMWLVRRRSH